MILELIINDLSATTPRGREMNSSDGIVLSLDSLNAIIVNSGMGLLRENDPAEGNVLLAFGNQ